MEMEENKIDITGQLVGYLQEQMPACGTSQTSENNRDVKHLNNYTIHKSAEFTSIVDFDYMVNSIRANGQYNPILLWNNKSTRRWEVVDGRHRMWACNELAIKVQTAKLPLTTLEEDLPAMVLDIQLTQQKVPNKNVSSAIMTRYLETYGDRSKGITAKALRLQYPHAMLTEKDMTAMKYLYTNMPLWFQTLERGKGVAPDGTYQQLTSPRALQKVAKDMYKSLKETPAVVEVDNVDKELAKLFATVNALVNTIDIPTPETGSKLSYVLQQLSLELATKYPAISIEDYEDDITYHGELA